MEKIIPYVLILVYTWIAVYWNFRKIKRGERLKKKNIIHIFEDILQLIVTGVIATTYGLFLDLSFGSMIWLGLTLIAIYWLIFNPWLNYVRLKDNPKLILIKIHTIWFYLGKGNIIDVLESYIPKFLRYPFKVGLIIFFYLMQ